MNIWIIVVIVIGFLMVLQVAIFYGLPLYKRHFQRTPKAILLDNQYRIVEAFEWRGEKYYMFEDPLGVTTGRGLTSLVFMEELLMRCSVEYLKKYLEACDAILTNGTRIDLPSLIRLNQDLKERVFLLGAVPEHVFKLASVVFFTKEESPFRYDHAYNRTKIEAWEKEGASMHDFFLKGPLGILLPFLKLEDHNSEKYLVAVEKMNQMHQRNLLDILSRKA